MTYSQTAAQNNSQRLPENSLPAFVVVAVKMQVRFKTFSSEVIEHIFDPYSKLTDFCLVVVGVLQCSLYL